MTSSAVWLSYVNGRAQEARSALHDVRLIVAESKSPNRKEYLKQCDLIYTTLQSMCHQAESAAHAARKETHHAKA